MVHFPPLFVEFTALSLIIVVIKVKQIECSNIKMCFNCISEHLTLWAWQNSSTTDLDSAVSPLLLCFPAAVPTLSQQSHFMWLRAGGGWRYSSQTLCVYPLIPEKKFTSVRKVLGDLATYLPNLLSLPLPCFPQPRGAQVTPGNVWEGFYRVCGCKKIIGIKLQLVSWCNNLQ